MQLLSRLTQVWFLQALFAIASCSKAFLVAAVGLLIDDYAHGRNVTPLPGSMRLLSWDTKMHHLLPDEWSFPEEWAESTLSLRDAFSHLSGLPRCARSLLCLLREDDYVTQSTQARLLVPPWRYHKRRAATAEASPACVRTAGTVDVQQPGPRVPLLPLVCL